MSWEKVADEISATPEKDDLIVVNDKIYGIGYAGLLVEWNGVDAWVSKAPVPLLGHSQRLESLNDEIYVTDINFLYKWNGVDDWVQITSNFIGGSGWLVIHEDDGNIYSGYSDLYVSSGGTEEFSIVATSADYGDTRMRSLCSYNNKIYSGTSTGHLLEYTPGINGWNLAADIYVGNDIVVALVINNNAIYGLYKSSGELLRWETGDTEWTQISNGNGASSVNDMIVIDDVFYCIGSNGSLFKLNESNEWENVAITSELTAGITLVEYNNKIYGSGT